MEHHILMTGYYYRAYFYARDEQLYRQGKAEMDEYAKNAAELLQRSQNFPELADLGNKIRVMQNEAGSYQSISKTIHDDIQIINNAMGDLSGAEDVFEEAFDKLFNNLDEEWDSAIAKGVAEGISKEEAGKLGILRGTRFAAAGMMETFDMSIGDFWQALAKYDTTSMTSSRENITSLLQTIDGAVKEARDNDKALLVKAESAVKAAGDALEKIDKAWSSVLAGATERVKHFNALLKITSEVTSFYLDKVREMADSNESMIRRANLSQLIGSTVMVLLGITLSVIITRSITRPINRIISGLAGNAGELARASGSISQSSQNLSEGATAQASSLEESSSALEEMASMTRQSADNARKTNETTQQTAAMVARGSRSVDDMAKAMAEINDSSEKISNIIKTIEEIAFQTNLLALNAAVEAARAGEAGKGFAVVADEVRNLAGRSAQAARDTTELIAGTVERVRNGSAISANLAENFKEIEAGVRQVGVLIADIDNATNEQAHGVEQVNTTVAQMDRVTQHNSQEAQHTQGEAANLQQQSEELNDMVNQLTRLVHGQNSHSAITVLGNGPGISAKRQKAMKALPPPKM